jgi:nucleoid-associated protein YgaU
MAAVLTPRPDLAPWNDPAERVRSPARPALRVLEGGRTGPAGRSASADAGVVVHRRPVATVVAGVALAALVAFAALGGAHLLGADAAASRPASTAEIPRPVGAGASTSPAPTEWVVQPGDTLWSIAERLRPGADVRPLVDELAARAGGADVSAGDRIDLSGLGD